MFHDRKLTEPDRLAAERLPEDQRQRCEVWTRVVGYHRPVSSFNTGKKGEFHERLHFEESRAGL